MAPGVVGIEGSTHGHDVIPVKAAIQYLNSRGYPEAKTADILNNIKPQANPYLYIGSSRDLGATRVIFGESVNLVLDGLSKEEAAKKVMVIDSMFVLISILFLLTVLIGDLEGSTGLKVIHQKHPEVFIPSGIMERGNFSAAAGFGFDKDKYGVFSTFGAFLEMIISELTMARLNFCNILCHFSHSGVDEVRLFVSRVCIPNSFNHVRWRITLVTSVSTTSSPTTDWRTRSHGSTGQQTLPR